ncbi:hypothetical protein CXB51_003692 [Gossypium anomalum]|uniref:TF-B3 domain-containing protein n=1 Tax=Gossypium anomalum TaxID=47600 RepID=A0A8J6D6H3_9ROSI|nr:hypothetical protein CXB51_003692 [Gossypium anomalum]
MASFFKVLTKIDIERTLSLPDSCLQALQQSQRSHGGKKLKVKDDIGILWNFRCTIRSGAVRRLHIGSGWIQFVRFKRLNTGDAIVLYKDDDTVTGPHYKIEVVKGHGDNYSSFVHKKAIYAQMFTSYEEIVKHAERTTVYKLRLNHNGAMEMEEKSCRLKMMSESYGTFIALYNLGLFRNSTWFPVGSNLSGSNS